LLALAAFALPSTNYCIAQTITDLDRYGGYKPIQLGASGYFRLEKAERWWFVTPEGSAFLTFGLNHTNPDYLTQDYNREFWKRKFGVEDISDPEFNRKFAAKVMDDLEYFGMNTLGSHSPKQKFPEIKIPYVQSLFFARTAYWLVKGPQSFPDVYGQRFADFCERKARSVAAPLKDDPFLMGYIFTNVPIFTDEDAAAHGEVPWGRSQPDMPTWPRVLRNLGQSSPGKHAFVKLAASRHGSIEAFNRVYKTDFRSFEALQAAEKWSPYIKANGIDDADDNRVFLLEILDQYYTVAVAAVRRHDPNHLIFGDTINANIGAPDEVVSTMARHTDLIAYQYYGEYDSHAELLDRWSALTGKPLFHADAAFTVQREEMPEPIGAVVANDEVRAKRFLDYARKAYARPDFVGWHWCGWVDMWQGWKADRQHPGLQDPMGNYHHPMPETLREFGKRIYEYGLGRSQ